MARSRSLKELVAQNQAPAFEILRTTLSSLPAPPSPINTGAPKIPEGKGVRDLIDHFKGPDETQADPPRRKKRGGDR